MSEGFRSSLHDLDRAHAGPPGHLRPVAVGRGDRRRPGQLHAQRLGQRVHRRRRAHGVAVADRGRRRGDDVEEARIVDLALGQQLARLPDDRPRPGALAAEPAVQHRPDRERDRRDVHRRRRHQERRRRLVAADGQHHPVERIAVEHLDQPEIGEVAVEPRRRPLAGLLDRMHRELHGDAAGVADAVAHPLGELQVMPVAGREVRAGLRDADDRLARLQLLAAQPVVQVALQVERRHVRVARIVEPGARAQRRGGGGLVGQGTFLPRALAQGMEPRAGSGNAQLVAVGA